MGQSLWQRLKSKGARGSYPPSAPSQRSDWTIAKSAFVDSSNPARPCWDCFCGRCRFDAPPPLPGLVRVPGRQRCIAAFGRERLLRSFFAALLTRMARLELLPSRHRVTRLSSGSSQLNNGALREPSRANLGGCMKLSRPPLVVTFELSEKRKAIVAHALAGASAVVYLTELEEAARAEALRNTGALLTFSTSKELRSGEARVLNLSRPDLMRRASYKNIAKGLRRLDELLAANSTRREA
jgi:hypothetical protein